MLKPCGQLYMLSFASPEIADSSSGQRIDFPDRAIRDIKAYSVAYGVLEVKGVDTLIVAGTTDSSDTYCEMYVVNGEWKKCESPQLYDTFDTSIFWQNRLVTLSGQGEKILHVYNHNPMEGGAWSKKTNAPDLSSNSKFFLNAEGHLCLDGERFSKRFTKCGV